MQQRFPSAAAPSSLSSSCVAFLGGETRAAYHTAFPPARCSRDCACTIMENAMHLSRRTILKATGLGALLGMSGGCDALGGVFGRMFAVPPRDTTYFTNNSKFYVVNYADSVV